jgi:hypothetical protein
MVTFTINIPPMLAYLPYMDPMGVSEVINKLTYPPGAPHCMLSNSESNGMTNDHGIHGFVAFFNI